MKIGIFPNIHRQKAIDVLKELIDIDQNNVRFIVSKDAMSGLQGYDYVFGDITDSDIIITLGGDGTLIKAVRECAKYNIPVLGFNLGRLGFLTEAKAHEVKEVLHKLADGDYHIEERMMIHAKLIKDGHVLQECLGLNDVVLSRKSLSRMIRVNVKVDQLLLDNYYADGVIVSTPTGSTGYSLSAGGPVIDPQMNVLTVTPICPHSLHSRSMVIAGEKKIYLEPDMNYNRESIVTIDGQISVDMQDGITVEVTKSDLFARLIKLGDNNFYDLLREKLANRDINN